jgi:hypothetical protein
VIFEWWATVPFVFINYSKNCVCAPLCAFVCIQFCVHLCAYTSACSCAHTLLRAFVCMHFCVQVCVCISACSCVRALLCAVVCVHFCALLCACSSVCSCMHALLCAVVCVHFCVHHLLLKLVRSGTYPDGPGEVVTCCGSSSVPKEGNGVRQLSVQLQFGHPCVTSTNSYSAAPQIDSVCLFPFCECGSGIVRHTLHTVFITLALCTLHNV